MVQTRNFSHGIQYLRGFAALVVVVHARHVFKPTPASWTDVGTYSVEIFLVVGGFVLAYTTATLPTLGPRLPIAGAFLWQRLLRLLPCYWAVQLIYSAPHLLEWFARSGLLREIYWNIDPQLQALALDLLLIPHPHPDRPDAFWPLVVPEWTLNLEACFYLVFTLSLLARKMSLELAAAILLCLFLIGQFHQPANAVAGFHVQVRILCFAVGVVVFRLMQWRRGIEWTHVPSHQNGAARHGVRSRRAGLSVHPARNPPGYRNRLIRFHQSKGLHARASLRPAPRHGRPHPPPAM